MRDSVPASLEVPAKMNGDLSGRVALVTGASAGLGARFARVLAAAGATVAIGARRTDRLAALAAELTQAGARAHAIALDVTRQDSIRAALEETERLAGPVDLLVNNSGVSTETPILDTEEADWDRVLDTNLKGAFLVSQAVARRLRDTGRPGSIINIASILGLRQGSALTSYAVSKAGLVQLTKQMALELARYRIRVNAIAPGYIRTDMNREFFDSGRGDAMLKRIPQRRLGEPAELDAPLLLLAGESGAFMTGSVIVVDGGHLVSSL